MILAHRIRLAPTPRQEDYFRRACGTARFVWNEALVRWKAVYEAGEKPSGRVLKLAFNVDKYERWPWLRNVHRDAHARPFDDLQSAFQHFFRRVKAGEKPGYPRFKRKGKSKDSFYVANDQFRLEGKVVRLPVVGEIKLRETLRFTGKIMSATVCRKADQWHLNVQVDVGDYHKPVTGPKRPVIGVDLGVKALAVLSTGEVVEGPKPLKKGLKHLRLLSKSVSRKAKGSNNRRKAVNKVARQHLKIADVRKDSAHKLTSRLLRENQAVVVEDLNVRGMDKFLGRHVADQGFAEIRRQLTYKAPIYGSSLVVADRWFPSSKRCSSCGKVKAELTLDEREYCCDFCGVIEDRDLNAARNLEQLGWATAEVKPVDSGSSGVVLLAALRETTLGEAGISWWAHKSSLKG